jgi:hypothetical protein
MLLPFNMLEKNICLLMSNQVVQVCDDLAELHSNARNVAADSMEAGARYAWVTLQSLNAWRATSRLSSNAIKGSMPPLCNS